MPILGGMQHLRQNIAYFLPASGFYANLPHR